MHCGAVVSRLLRFFRRVGGRHAAHLSSSASRLSACAPLFLLSLLLPLPSSSTSRHSLLKCPPPAPAGLSLAPAARSVLWLMALSAHCTPPQPRLHTPLPPRHPSRRSSCRDPGLSAAPWPSVAPASSRRCSCRSLGLSAAPWPFVAPAPSLALNLASSLSAELVPTFALALRCLR